MIDFHNHVLPGVDDGPREISVSLDMLRTASKQGITEVVQTVHFQHPKMEGKNTDHDYLTKKVNVLQNLINKENLNINIHLSAEVFYLPNLVEISDNLITTIGNKKYMLIEFTSNIFPENYEKEFYNLQLSGITPIIAHPERYRFIQNDMDILKKWIDRDYVIQIDAGSILGKFGKHTQKISLDMLNNDYIHLIGSDAHNNNKRNFCLKEAYKKIELIKSIEYVEFLKKNAFNILNGLKIINLKSKKKDSLLKKIISKFKN